ncbi:DinB family protein [Psychrobacillus sp. NPDC058041]|uniref:DinB family protein n=1 Tax=Psychrobacillus sp. NPDC058041 TaxID=3346310 RepID=UPI0036DDC936
MIKDINTISNLNEVIEFSNKTKTNTLIFLQSYTSEIGKKIIEMKSKNGTTYSFSYDKIIRHVITHEVHHIGQLSIWSREIGIKPISSDLLFKQ